MVWFIYLQAIGREIMIIILGFPMLTFVVAWYLLRFYVKRMIPDRVARIKFKSRHEFIIAMLYLFIPLLLLQNELIYLNNVAVPYTELPFFAPLVILKISLFIIAALNFESIFQKLKNYSSYWKIMTFNVYFNLLNT